ncbi:hypothetical protein K438DRAFT_2071053 [Mycena galopus ATCC 62051]|nr:hypothetical protein K438DRAFT_2071053 [Mycena galopus ATCC 62051]
MAQVGCLLQQLHVFTAQRLCDLSDVNCAHCKVAFAPTPPQEGTQARCLVKHDPIDLAQRETLKGDGKESFKYSKRSMRYQGGRFPWVLRFRPRWNGIGTLPATDKLDSVAVPSESLTRLAPDDAESSFGPCCQKYPKKSGKLYIGRAKMASFHMPRRDAGYRPKPHSFLPGKASPLTIIHRRVRAIVLSPTPSQPGCYTVGRSAQCVHLTCPVLSPYPTPRHRDEVSRPQQPHPRRPHKIFMIRVARTSLFFTWLVVFLEAGSPRTLLKSERSEVGLFEVRRALARMIFLRGLGVLPQFQSPTRPPARPSRMAAARATWKPLHGHYSARAAGRRPHVDLRGQEGIGVHPTQAEIHGLDVVKLGGHSSARFPGAYLGRPVATASAPSAT